MALLVEGLAVGSDTAIEEYIIEPPDAYETEQDDTEKVKIYGPGAGLSWVARPVKGQSRLGSAISLVSRQGTMPLMDPIVPLFGSIHDKAPEVLGSMRSTMFPNFGSMFSMADQQPRPDHNWDEESQREGEGEGEDDRTENVGDDSDDNLQSPLLSRQATSMEGKEISLAQGNSSLFQVGPNGEAVSGMGIGGGWQLAWKWSETDGEFKRMYLHPEGTGGTGSVKGSFLSVTGGGEIPEESGGYVQAAALVSQPALFSKDLMGQNPVGPAMVHPSETAVKGPKWQNLLEPGVTRALTVGIGLQILQQVLMSVSYFGGVVFWHSYKNQFKLILRAFVGLCLQLT